MTEKVIEINTTPEEARRVSLNLIKFAEKCEEHIKNKTSGEIIFNMWLTKEGEGIVLSWNPKTSKNPY